MDTCLFNIINPFSFWGFKGRLLLFSDNDRNSQLYYKFTVMLRRFLIRYAYRTMTPEDYLFNQRDSNLAHTLHSKGLGVLENSNQGPPNVTDEVTLVGVPKGQYHEPAEGFDSLIARMKILKPDLIFLQVDPSEYVARERWAAHKCALKKMEDYYLDGVERIDPLKPHTW
jgi:hypothetical protein